MNHTGPAPDPASDPWPQYASAVVELAIDGEHLVLTPCPDPSHVAAVAAARALRRWGPPIWVLTAGDPYPLELSAGENAARRMQLRAELDTLGLRHDPALGRAPDGSTSEISVAVRGSDRDSVLALAARHGQLAVYEIDDLIRCVDVASASEVTAVAFVLASAPLASGALVGPTGWSGER